MAATRADLFAFLDRLGIAHQTIEHEPLPTVEAAMEKYAEDYAPLTDMRATAGYRALVAKNLLLRFYTETTSGAASAQVSRYEAA